MKKYKVEYSYVVYEDMTIDAEYMEDAVQKVKKILELSGLGKATIRYSKEIK